MPNYSLNHLSLEQLADRRTILRERLAHINNQGQSIGGRTHSRDMTPAEQAEVLGRLAALLRGRGLALGIRAQAEADEGRLHDRQILLDRMRREMEGTAAGARAVMQAALPQLRDAFEAQGISRSGAHVDPTLHSSFQ